MTDAKSMLLLAFKTPRRCEKCLNFMGIDSWRPLNDCNEACLMGIRTETLGDMPGEGHLHWECPDCGWREATLTAKASGRDRWRQ